MRGTVAKQIRKQARLMAVNFPERNILEIGYRKSVHVTNRKHKDFGKTIDVTMRSAINDPKTVRGVYQALKRAWKRARNRA